MLLLPAFVYPAYSSRGYSRLAQIPRRKTFLDCWCFFHRLWAPFMSCNQQCPCSSRVDRI